ncbi:MAG: DUF3365 domain-containing protein [Cyanobacteria bacterium P01_G01_bin.19]
MINKLGLGTKFNALLLLFFIVGTVISGFALSAAMQSSAESEVAARAEILTQTMNSVRNYTSNNIKPLLADRLATESEFIPETVPAYSAREVFENFRLRPEYQSFLYKEATLNPTNLRDKADEFETEIVTEFRQNSSLTEKTGYYDRDGEKLFYIARPLSVQKLSCLQCHGKAKDAPKSMLNTYGTNNGFGWKLHEIVAAQTIYVPANEVFAKAHQYWLLAIAIFIAIFILVMGAINLLLRRAVIKPLKQLTNVTRSWRTHNIGAESAAIDSQKTATLARRHDEPGQLAKAFQHLKLEIISRESKLQQAQAEIERSEVYFRSLIERASDVIFILDCQQKIAYVSPSASEILGYQSQVMLGNNLLDFILPELHFSIADFLNLAAQQPGISVPIEMSFKHQNGAWLATEAIANNLLNDPAVNGIVLNLRDITEREQVDERLRLLESVVVNANDAIVITEAKSLAAPEHPKIVYVNKAFSEITGYSFAEVIGKTPRILQGKKSDRRILEEIKQSLARYLPIKTELINYGKDGREYWVELNIIPIADRKGHYTHYMALERDVTERKQAEQELRDREASIRSLYEVTTKSDRSFSLRVEQILAMGCQQFNLEVGILSKIEGEQYRVIAVKLPDNSTLDINAGNIFAVENTCCDRTIQTQQPVSFLKMEIEHPCYLDANPLTYLGTKVMVGGEVYGTLNFSSLRSRTEPFKTIDLELIELMAQWIGGEIERRKSRSKLAQARDAAEAANKAKGDFLATMSHEIRTPMNAVIGMTGLLLNTKLDSQQQDFVNTIRSSGDALLTLINDILDFSKIEAGKLEFENQPFQLNRCIEEALNLVATKAEAKQLELAYSIAPEVPNYIQGDITRLRQILVNLLSNAVKFTEKGEVVVYVREKQIERATANSEDSSIFMTKARTKNHNICQIEFAVKDTGIGIPRDRLDRLFKSFSQVDSSTTRQYGGTGLGLAISKKLSEMMGGKMWVTSEAGVGSTFYFTISANVAPEPREVLTPSNRLAGKQLLIVDDNATNRQILTLQAQTWATNSHAVKSGAEALKLMSTGIKLDLAILDMQMPGMDGLTLAMAIRQQRQYQDLPLVMLTSLGKQEILQQAQDLNFAAIVNKPIAQSQLYCVLTQAIAGMPIKVKSTDTSFLNANLANELPLNILLAEDIVVNQKVAILILKQMGYRADIANNGIEVIAALRRQIYDVVLMDMQMPEMDGLTATKLIYEEFDPKIRPRIIAMTANAMTGDRKTYLAAGMDDYVSKPIRVKELREALVKCKPVAMEKEWGDGETGKQGDEEIEDSVSIDLSVLESICEMAGEEASLLLEEMVTSYLDDTEIRLQAIANAIEAADAESIFQAAHSMKSSSANLGAVNLVQLCEELERLGKDKTIEGTESLLINAESEFQQVGKELKEFLKSIN